MLRGETHFQHREIVLPRPVDAQAGTVTFGNGVLVVSLPVTDTVRPGRRRLETVGPARRRRAPRPAAGGVNQRAGRRGSTTRLPVAAFGST